MVRIQGLIGQYCGSSGTINIICGQTQNSRRYSKLEVDGTGLIVGEMATPSWGFHAPVHCKEAMVLVMDGSTST